MELVCIIHNRAVKLAECFQDGKETKMITSGGVERMESVCSSQEDADASVMDSQTLSSPGW